MKTKTEKKEPWESNNTDKTRKFSQVLNKSRTGKRFPNKRNCILGKRKYYNTEPKRETEQFQRKLHRLPSHTERGSVTPQPSAESRNPPQEFQILCGRTRYSR